MKMLHEIEASAAGQDEKGKKAITEARRDAERTLRVLAVQYHNEWKKTRDEPVAGYAAAVYRDYLDVFPNEPTAYEMRFFHAELRYALADFAGAGEEYERVALQDVRTLEAKPKPGEAAPKAGKFFKDALENAVFAWDLVAKKLDDEKRRRVAPPTRRSGSPSRRSGNGSSTRACATSSGSRRARSGSRSPTRPRASTTAHNAFAEATDCSPASPLDHPAHELAGYSDEPRARHVQPARRLARR